MSQRHLSVEVRAGILYVTIDTPACRVNIFGPQAAVELLELLGAIDANVRALVLKSAKPSSFINGASLMLGSAVSKPEDLPRLTAPLRKAYDALRDLRIPTLAAMRGNCFGCGVELALRCRYRVGGDSYDAHVYMPEVVDYLLVPAFGATQSLPRVVGLEAATDLLLWGHRWPARVAVERGLLHACFSDAEFDDAVSRVATDLAEHGLSSALAEHPGPPAVDVRAFGERTRARIGQLPPAYRAVYADCYALMESAVEGRLPEAQGFDDEVLASGRTAATPTSKAAVGFFFVRQSAEQVCLRDVPDLAQARIGCDPASDGARFLCAELESKRIRGLTYDDRTAGSDAREALRIVTLGTPSAPSREHGIAVQIAPVDRSPEGAADVVLYAPAWPRGSAFVEIACSEPSLSAKVAAQVLAKGDVPSVITRPGQGFVTDDLIRAYLQPHVASLRAGAHPRDLAATLQGFGFIRLAGDSFARWSVAELSTVLASGGADRAQIAEVVPSLPLARDAAEGSVRESFRDAVLISLLAFAFHALSKKRAAHPSIIDVMSRELIDFPIAHTSLCRHLTVARARALLDSNDSVESLVTGEALDLVREYVDHGQSFYR